jgi:MoaA/NifB/PqqE/SkfB family radical SAM enzyme
MNIYKNFSEINLKPWKKHIYFGLFENSVLTAYLPNFINKTLNNLFLISRPIMIRIETVNICNNNCLICTKQISKRKKEIMSVDLFEKILSDYSKIGGGDISLTPTGGEIFLDKYLLDRLDLIKNYPKIRNLSVTTNGVFSDRYSDDDLSKILSRFNRIQISIYGIDEEEYKTMTRRNTYDRMIKNIQRILHLNEDSTKIILGFRFLKNRETNQIDDWIEKNFSQKIEFLYTNYYHNWGNKKITEIKLPFDAKWFPPCNNSSKCIYPLIGCQIFSNGDVSFCPCPDYNGDIELHIGNIKKTNLLQIINSKKVQYLWDSSRKIPNYCQFCNAFKPFNNVNELIPIFNNPSIIFGA